ncbi:MAG: Holliday junction resolvase RuvX [Nocardiaceae bacterium]|nr:Holliday junction resolvase RuvX [Nocardiaceae bacterium]
MTFQRGRRLGIDVGAVRIGVAVSDPDGILATPVETVQFVSDGSPESADIRRICEIVAEYEAVEVIVGLPTTLQGRHGNAAEAAEEFAARLRSKLDVPIHMSDERLTTVFATRALRDSGVRARKQRQVIDQAAAVAILQNWLDGRTRSLGQDS